MYIKNKNIPKIIENLAALSTTQHQIIVKLLEAPDSLGDHVFHGGYTELTAALNRKKTDISTIRRITLDLAKKGIINIIYNPDHIHRIDYIELPVTWMDHLAAITLPKEKHNYMKIKRDQILIK